MGLATEGSFSSMWEDAKGWTFESRPTYFKYTPGSRLIFVFRSKGSKYASLALPLDYGQEATLPEAQARAKRWLKDREARGGVFPVLQKLISTPEVKVPKNPPKGPHCSNCLKEDEDDLVDYSGSQFCMVCYITAART